MRYDINLKRIEEQLKYMKKCVDVSDTVIKYNEMDDINEFALARCVHISTECFIDVGNTLIDGFIMRDPGGYHDIVDILLDEQVISSDLATILKELVTIRKKLIRDYHLMRRDELLSAARELGELHLFHASVNDFLKRELFDQDDARKNH